MSQGHGVQMWLVTTCWPMFRSHYFGNITKQAVSLPGSPHNLVAVFDFGLPFRPSCHAKKSFKVPEMVETESLGGYLR